MRKYIQNVGGLGNQLFIWNAAHKLALTSKGQIRIISPKKSDRSNELEVLTPFCEHNIQVLETDFIFRLLRLGDRLLSRFERFKYVYNLLGIFIYSSPTESLSEDPDIVLHRGYFQNNEMLSQSSKVVLDEIEKIVQQKFKKVQQKIEFPNCYEAFHIRRGDFLENKESIGILTDDFYHKLRSKLPLLVSTETESDLNSNFGAFYTSTAGKDDNWEAFSMLANANRLVTANSTFSWWAGRISKYMNADSVVVQPDSYFKTGGPKGYLKCDIFAESKAEYL